MKTFIKIYYRYIAFLLLASLPVLFYGCDKPKDSAMNRLMMARSYHKNFLEYMQGVQGRSLEAYKQYKTVFNKNRAVMTHKDIAAMYSLGLGVEKDKKFLQKIRTIYEQEKKATQS